MSEQRTLWIRLLFVALCVLVGACGSTSDTTSGASTDEPVEIGPIGEQDLELARARFEAAKRLWESQEPFSYTFRAGVQTINMIEIDFDAEGNASPERVVLGEDTNLENLPRSVDEAFDQIDARIAQFETGELEVPDEGDCGHHFYADFHPELGAPWAYDGLSPCDDGVGLQLEIIPVE